MTGNFFDGKKGRSLDNIIAKLSRVRTPRLGNRILLVSEKNNACLSLSSEESEDGEADLHQCGHCRQMFTNLSCYITHKIEKPCRAGLANRDSEWSNEATSFTNEVPTEDGNKNLSGAKHEPADKDGEIRFSSQESQKRKHDRKGLARRLNVTGSPDGVEHVSSPNDVSKIDSEILAPVGENDNPVIVVVNEAGPEKELNSEMCTDIDNCNRELTKSRHLTPNILHTPTLKPQTEPNPLDMPFLKRIRTNNHNESMAIYPATGFPNFPPRITDKMQNVFPTHSGDNARENFYSSERIPIENHIEHDMRKSWPEINKKNPSYSPHVDPDIHGCYPPPPHHLYNPPFPGMPYANPYIRHSGIPQFGKPCCSSEHSVNPHFAGSQYTISHASSDRMSKKIYDIDPNVYSMPYNSSKTQDKLDKKERESKIKSPGSQTASKHQSNVQKGDEIPADYTKPRDEKSIGEEKTSKETEENITDRDPTVHADEQIGMSEAPPQLVKIVNLSGKENYDSPSSSMRPESYETNSQAGSFRSRDSTPTSTISDSPPSSNQSVDPTISPSQVYDGGVLRVAPEVSEDASKQSMESESLMIVHPGKITPVENSGSPNSERYLNESSLGETDDVFSQERAASGHQSKRPRSVDINVNRGNEENLNDTSSPPSDPSWRHSKQVYRCPLCAKIFPFKSKLQRHVLVHTGIKPYKCSVCGRGFTQQIDLQRHLTRHTGEKPFKCHLCKAQFIRADNLRKHAKDTHFVNIEEPIRKRRRKTTGSDTVLPPLEVAIAMAINETEKNGGRVLGRSSNRTGRNARRDRMLSLEEEQRRMEHSAETFSRPTMGSIPSHQFSGGPPSIGFPHGPSIPPFSRHPSELYDPAINDRPSSPPHQLLPPRYHPGSMVFQPRSMADRYLERPYFNRQPGDLPPMYWSSPPRHAHISPPSDRSQVFSRERFNSEASEGAASVFDGKEDGQIPEGSEDSMARRSEMSSGDVSFNSERSRKPERSPRLSDSRISEERIPVTPEKITISSHGERDMPHLPDARMPQISGGSPRVPEDKILIHTERSRASEERIWSIEDRIRTSVSSIPRSYDGAVFRMPDDPSKQDDSINRSPKMVIVTQSDQKQLSPGVRFQDSVEHPVPRIDNDRGIQQRETQSPSQEDMRNHLRLPDPWSRYDRNTLDVSLKNVVSYRQDDVSSMNYGKKDIPVSPKERKNGFRTQHEEFVSS